MKTVEFANNVDNPDEAANTALSGSTLSAR